MFGVFFFFQAEDGIRDSDMWLEFRRVLFRSDMIMMCKTFQQKNVLLKDLNVNRSSWQRSNTYTTVCNTVLPPPSTISRKDNHSNKIMHWSVGQACQIGKVAIQSALGEPSTLVCCSLEASSASVARFSRSASRALCGWHSTCPTLDSCFGKFLSIV